MAKKLLLGVMAIACCLTAIGGTTFVTPAHASAIRKTVYSTTPSQKNDIEYLSQHTTLSKDELNSMLNQGLSKGDIQNLYVLRMFADKDHKSYDKVLSVYRELGKDTDKVLDSFGVEDKNQFKDSFERTFPKGDDTNFGRVLNLKNLRYKPF